MAMEPISTTERADCSPGMSSAGEAFGGHGGTARQGGSTAWVMSSSLGPRFALAPDGIADIGGGDAAADGTKPDAGKPDPVATKPADGGSDRKPDAAAKAERPDWLPESLWDAEKGFRKEDFDGLVASKAAADSRAASVPESADKYEIKLPASFKLPHGVELPQGEKVIDENDPRVAEAREYALSQKMTQSDFEEMLAFGAKMDIAERQRLNDAVKAEREKLGGRAKERVKAVTTFLDAKLGAEMARSLHSMMFTATQVEAFERLIQLSIGDVVGRPGAGREAKPSDVSDEEWSKMSPTQKINYARQRSPAPIKGK